MAQVFIQSKAGSAGKGVTRQHACSSTQQVGQYSRCCSRASAEQKEQAVQLSSAMRYSRPFRRTRQAVPPDRRLEDELRALLLVDQLVHPLLHGAFGDQAVHGHRLVGPPNAVRHGQGLHVPPATKEEYLIEMSSHRCERHVSVLLGPLEPQSLL